jgi:hypothetical protein
LQSLFSSRVVMFYSELSKLEDFSHNVLFDGGSDPYDNLWCEI